MKTDILNKMKHELATKNVVFIIAQNKTFMLNDFSRNHLLKIQFVDMLRMIPVEIDLANSEKTFDDVIRIASDEEVLKCIHRNKEI